MADDDVASMSTQEVGMIRQRMQRRLSDNAKLMYEAALDEANPEDSPRGAPGSAGVTGDAPSRRSSMDLTRGSGAAAQAHPNRRRSSTNSRRSSLARAAGRRASLARERNSEQAGASGAVAISQGRRSSIARARAVREAAAARNECQARAVSASSNTTAGGATAAAVSPAPPAPPAPPTLHVNSCNSAAASLRAFGRRSQRSVPATTKAPPAVATAADTKAALEPTSATYPHVTSRRHSKAWQCEARDVESRHADVHMPIPHLKEAGHQEQPRQRCKLQLRHVP